MNEIKCPNCGEVFTVNESQYSELFGVSTDYLLKDELEELPATAIAVD